MPPLSVHRVSVWLDSLAPDRGAFAHALDWAGHLEVPLRVFVAQPDPRGGSWANAGVPAAASAGGMAETIRACAATCDYNHVPLDATSWCGPVGLGVREFLHPTDLCVFGGTLPPHEMEALLQGYFDSPATPALICPPTWQPLMRVLVVNQARGPGNRFIEAAADLCLGFRARPVVLTVAASTAAAEGSQRGVEQAFAARGLAGDFDAAVGCQVRSAVAWAAHWHNCSHVFVERRTASPLWRWLREDTVERLLGLTDAVAVLAVPGVPLAAGAVGPGRDTRPAATGGRFQPCDGSAAYPPTRL
jgi:hypothetical protein